VAEQPEKVRASLSRLAVAVAEGFDLAAIEAVARSAPTLHSRTVEMPVRVGACRIAVAAGPAFTFSYRDNLEALEAAGAELIPFDPVNASALPEPIDGLVAGGGFPEVHGEALAANRPLLADAAQRIAHGLPTWAECGGMLWLAEELDGRPMVGAVPTAGRLGDRLVLGYRQAETTAASPIGPAGTTLRGHEFHYSTCAPGGDALRLTSRFAATCDGFATPTLLATYLHHHAGGDPELMTRFVRTCVAARVAAGGSD
jgi:cobyrinic acid a,c-diamide synthase